MKSYIEYRRQRRIIRSAMYTGAILVGFIIAILLSGLKKPLTSVVMFFTLMSIGCKSPNNEPVIMQWKNVHDLSDTPPDTSKTLETKVEALERRIK